MPRRDDGNEPVRVRPQRSVGSRAQEIREHGQSPAPESPQVDLPVAARTSGVTAPAGKLDFSFLPNICLRGLQPSNITPLIVRLLQGVFSDPANIRNPSLKDLIWVPDSSTSKITITSSTYVNQPEGGKLPRLIVKRGQQRCQRLAIGDFSGTESSTSTTNTESYTRFTTGQSVVTVVGESGQATEALVEEVFLALSFLSPEVVKTSPFLDFQVAMISGIEQEDGTGSTFSAQISIDYVYETAWTTTSVGPTIRGLQLSMPPLT